MSMDMAGNSETIPGLALGVTKDERHLNITPRPTPRRRLTLNRRSVRTLLQEGQSHLFDHWPPPGENDDDKLRFSEQVEKFSAWYPGGLAAYVRRAKSLLEYAKDNQRHKEFEGYTPTVAEGVTLSYGSKKFMEFEDAAVKEFDRVAFVLVAGGLAERLDCENHIKVQKLLPSFANSLSLPFWNMAALSKPNLKYVRQNL